jgi:DNA polymerase III delta' subunit
MGWSIAGADAAKRSLEGMMASGRLPHAVLLTGPAGGGKFTFARDLAMAVNCEAPGAPAPPCGECGSCRRILAGSHPDVAVLEPKGAAAQIPIDDVRALRDTLNYKAYEGRVKTALVRGADRFSEESGGALLKTLEEPSPDTLLVLTATSASAVMSTLVSRCVTFRIPPLPRKDLLHALAGAGIPAGPDAELLCGLSGGALGKALSIDLEYAKALRAGIEGVFRWPKGPPRLAAAIRFAGVMSEGYNDAKASREDADSADARDWLELAERSLRLFWRDAEVLAASGDAALMEGPPPSPALTSLARELAGAGPLPDFERICRRMVDSVRRYIRSDLVFENFWSDVLR